MQEGTPAADVMKIWSTKLPTKIKFFGWLLSRGRLNTRAYLHYRNIKTLEESWCALCTGVMETDAHIFSECHRARDVWARLGFFVPGNLVQRPWDIGVSTPLPDNVRLDIVLLILWHLWKSRNAVIFDQADSSSQDVINRVARDIDSWISRYKKILPYVREWRTWPDHFVTLF